MTIQTKKRNNNNINQNVEDICRYYNLNSSQLDKQFNESINPGINYLIREPWFQLLRNNIIPSVIENTKVLNITTTETKAFDILQNLKKFLKQKDQNIESKQREISLLKLLNKIQESGFNKVQRYLLRKYLEVDDIGRQLKTNFFKYIKNNPDIELDNNLLLNPFTSIINLAEIHRQIKYQTVVNWSCDDLEGLPDQVIAMSEKPITEQEVLPYCRVLAMFNKLTKNTKNPKPLILYLINYRKEFMKVKNRMDLVFTSSEINTGVCNGTAIIISRKEESVKTLMHELIHFHDLDFKYEVSDLDKVVNDVTNNNVVTSQRNSDGSDRFNLGEAHTECLASIVFLLFNTYTQPETVFIEKLKQQILYTLAKQADILGVSGCKNNYVTDATCKISESTNLYSYFFVKSYLYFNIKKWLTGCCKEFRFRSDDDTAYNNLKKILVEGANNTLIHRIVAAFQKSENKRANEKEINKRTLKMVCLA